MFNILDTDSSGSVEREELTMGLRCDRFIFIYIFSSRFGVIVFSFCVCVVSLCMRACVILVQLCPAVSFGE